MNHWQDLVVLGLIGVAAIYLARILWFRLSKRGGIGCLSCRSCSCYRGTDDQQDRSTVVNVSAPSSDADRQEAEG